MNAALSLPSLKARGIELWAQGETLRYRAPAGTVTPDLLAAMKAHKPEIMAELRRQTFAVFENENAVEYVAERTSICAADGLPPAMLRPVFTCTLRGHAPFTLLGRIGETLETTARDLRVQFGDDFVLLELHNVRPPA